MSAKQSPRFASYLLDTFGVSAALTGDLMERYARGRSRFWFWRQTLAAIPIGAFTDIRDHKLLFARSIFTFILVVNVLGEIPYRLRALIYGPVFSVSELRLIGAVVYLAAGWLIGRLHRPFGGSMVLGTICLAWIYSMPRTLHLISNVMEHERYRPYVYAQFIVGIEATICLLIGALLSASTARSTHPSSSSS